MDNSSSQVANVGVFRFAGQGFPQHRHFLIVILILGILFLVGVFLHHWFRYQSSEPSITDYAHRGFAGAPTCSDAVAAFDSLVRSPADSERLWLYLTEDARTPETCVGKLTPERRSELAALFTERQPNVAASWYQRGVVELGGSDPRTALTYFSRAMDIGVLSEEQLQYLTSLPSTADELVSVAPSRFSALLGFVQRVKRVRLDFLDRHRQGIAERFNAAVVSEELESHTLAELRDGASLALCLRSEFARRRLDAEIASLANRMGDKAYATISTLRAGRTFISAPIAVVPQDPQPTSEMLAWWHPPGTSRTSSLDQIGMSFGVAVPSGARVDFLILSSNRTGTRLAPTDIGVYASDDNERFHPIPTAAFIYAQPGKKDLIGIVFQEMIDTNFLKVSYLGSSRRGNFHHGLHELVQIYGSSDLRPGEVQ